MFRELRILSAALEIDALVSKSFDRVRRFAMIKLLTGLKLIGGDGGDDEDYDADVCLGDNRSTCDIGLMLLLECREK